MLVIVVSYQFLAQFYWWQVNDQLSLTHRNLTISDKENHNSQGKSGNNRILRNQSQYKNIQDYCSDCLFLHFNGNGSQNFNCTFFDNGACD